MLEIMVISIGLVLVIEGVLYFILANKLNLLLSFIKNLNPNRVKNISLTMVFIGFCLIYFIIRRYI